MARDTTATSVALSWKSKLITNEDPYHVHKTLGCFVLLSYAFRLACYASDGIHGNDSDMLFASHPEWTLPTVFLHFLLNVSSFEFKLPPRRIVSGYRIWPEYRAHSLTFLIRHLAVITLIWYERTYRMGQPSLYWMNMVIVLMNLLGADFGSYRTRPHNSRSIRDLEIPAWVKYCFTLAQFGGTVNAVYGIRRSSIPFLMSMVIQCNAFLMTLQRKNLASHGFLVTCYGILLVVITVIGNMEVAKEGIGHSILMNTMVLLSFLLRVSPPVVPVLSKVLQNKFILWIVIWWLIQHFRPTSDNQDTVPFELGIAFCVCVLCVIGLGYARTCQSDSMDPSQHKKS